MNETRRLIDVPVESSEDESLGIGQYAEILSNFIKHCDTPISIGIQGDWGIGKTSLLNMVEEKLSLTRKGSEKYHTIYFNTWQYSQFKQEESLGLSILKGIMNEIAEIEALKEKMENDSAQKSRENIIKMVKIIGNQILKQKTGIDYNKAEAETKQDQFQHTCDDEDIVNILKKMKTDFSKLVQSMTKETGDKLVIMIDDLDRIKPVRALEFLEAIKNFLDVEGCVFIIAIDYSVVQIGMAEKLGRSAQELQGKSYFDKIIQVPFNMPVTSYQTQRYIMSLLGWDSDLPAWDSDSESSKAKYTQHKREEFFLKISDQSIKSDDAKYFENICSVTVGKNPRSIKRTVNYANLLKMIVLKNRKGTGQRWTLVDAKILFPLACMQLAWPELFECFVLEPSPSRIHMFEDFEYLSNLPELKPLFKRSHDPEQVKSNITAFFDELINLIDKDDDGKVTSEEFKPIREMMKHANLTVSDFSDLQDQWKSLEELIKIRNQIKKQFSEEKIANIIGLFKKSESIWNNPSKLRLIKAGKKFYNILWMGKQIGSFASTQKESIQFYLKKDFENIQIKNPDNKFEYLKDVKNEGHYGTGNLYVDLEKILESGDGVTILNFLHKVVLEK